MMLLIINHQPLIVVALLAIVTLLFVAVTVRCGNNELDKSVKIIRAACENGFNFDSTKQFTHDFIPVFTSKDVSATEKSKLKNCYEDSLDAILSLGKLMNDANLADVCHPKHIKQIIEYHNQFIAHPAKKKPYISDNLFKTYILQVDFICKKNLLANLKQAIQERHISEKDYQNLLPWLEEIPASPEEKLDAIGKPIDDFESLRQPLELKDDPTPTGKKTEVPAGLDYKTWLALVLLKHTCAERLRQTYSSIFFPLFQLSQLGYSYRGESVATIIKELGQNPLVSRWYTISEICEIFWSLNVVPAGDGDYVVKMMKGVGDNDRERIIPTFSRNSMRGESDGIFSIKSDKGFKKALMEAGKGTIEGNRRQPPPVAGTESDNMTQRVKVAKMLKEALESDEPIIDFIFSVHEMIRREANQ